MTIARILTTTLFAVVAIAVSLPRQSSSICDGQPEVPIGSDPVIQVWNDDTVMGFLSPSYFEGSDPAYSWLTYQHSEAVNGAFSCGQPGSGTFVMGAANAISIPGSDSAAIGLVVNQWSTTLGPGNSNGGWIAATYSSPSGARPLPIEAVCDGCSFEGSVWTIQSGTDSTGRSHQYLIPHWVNPDGSTVPLVIAALPFQGEIAVTGDFNAFVEQKGYLGKWIEVQFTIGFDLP